MGRTVAPWPQPYPLKCALHGDSMVTTLSDSGDGSASLRPRMPQIVQKLTGIADIWANNIGGTGFIADNSGARSDFIEQAGVDFTGAGFDVVWELGGRNDWPFYGSAAAYQAVVESWIDILLADNPDTIILLTGPLTVQNSEAYQASAAYAAIQNAKKAAAANYPQNCAFIETAGNAVTNNPWIFGTGKQGATTGNGTADLVRGPDGVHLTIYGHEYIATRLVTETARVLPMLASRIRDGVIAGVNNLDLS
jgi:lysophospholipase L1-like esterase